MAINMNEKIMDRSFMRMANEIITINVEVGT